jgi:dihydrofolate reductase
MFPAKPVVHGKSFMHKIFTGGKILTEPSSRGSIIMRKIILFIATSLDGFIAGRSGEIDWLFTDQDYGYAEFLNTIDVVIMGRKTYEQVLTFGEYPYKGIEGYVFSRSRAGMKDKNVALLSGDVANFVHALKEKPGKNIWLVGGAGLIHAFMQHNLIDEYVISVHPIVLGSGIPLFRSPIPATKLVFMQSRTFGSGLVQLTYGRG